MSTMEGGAAVISELCDSKQNLLDSVHIMQSGRGIAECSHAHPCLWGCVSGRCHARHLQAGPASTSGGEEGPPCPPPHTHPHP